jgi:hypothetical protein
MTYKSKTNFTKDDLDNIKKAYDLTIGKVISMELNGVQAADLLPGTYFANYIPVDRVYTVNKIIKKKRRKGRNRKERCSKIIGITRRKV